MKYAYHLKPKSMVLMEIKEMKYSNDANYLIIKEQYGSNQNIMSCTY